MALGTYIINNYTNYIKKVSKNEIEFKKQQKRNKEHRKTKNQFFRTIAENADLYKSVVNKIMTTDEECLKYNFVSFLRKLHVFLIRKPFLA